MAGPQNACMLSSIICVKLWRHIRSQRGVAFLYSAMSTVPSVLSPAFAESPTGTASVGSVSDLAMMKNVKQKTSMWTSHSHQDSGVHGVLNRSKVNPGGPNRLIFKHFPMGEHPPHSASIVESGDQLVGKRPLIGRLHSRARRV